MPGASAPSETAEQAKKKQDLESKLQKNKQTRDAARETRLYVQGEEEKLPEEDYNLIDEYYNSTYNDL